MQWMWLFLFVIITASCTTTPKSEDLAPGSLPPAGSAGPVDSGKPSIDYIGLQRAMGMEIPTSRLGYQEKSFNTCHAGYGYSRSNNCRREYMVVINFQLQCRDSEGTVAEGVTSSDLTAIANQEVRWNLKPNQGNTRTDSDGFGQILTVAARSPKRERLKIGVGNEFLYMRANEITRVVTPRPWCQP